MTSHFDDDDDVLYLFLHSFALGDIDIVYVYLSTLNSCVFYFLR